MRFDQPLSEREIQLFLHTLSSAAHRRSNLRSSLWFSRHGDGTQHLPTRASQTERLDQSVALFQQQCIEPKNTEDDFRHRIDGFGVLRQNLSPFQKECISTN